MPKLKFIAQNGTETYKMYSFESQVLSCKRAGMVVIATVLIKTLKIYVSFMSAITRT